MPFSSNAVGGVHLNRMNVAVLSAVNDATSPGTVKQKKYVIRIHLRCS